MTAQEEIARRMNDSWSDLAAGNMHQAILTTMEAQWGAYFYILFFGIPNLVIFIKSKDFGLATMGFFYTISAYGYLFPGSTAGTHISYFIMLALGATIYKALGVFK